MTRGLFPSGIKSLFFLSDNPICSPIHCCIAYLASTCRDLLQWLACTFFAFGLISKLRLLIWQPEIVKQPSFCTLCSPSLPCAVGDGIQRCGSWPSWQLLAFCLPSFCVPPWWGITGPPSLLGLKSHAQPVLALTPACLWTTQALCTIQSYLPSPSCLIFILGEIQASSHTRMITDMECLTWPSSVFSSQS